MNSDDKQVNEKSAKKEDKKEEIEDVIILLCR